MCHFDSSHKIPDRSRSVLQILNLFYQLRSSMSEIIIVNEYLSV